VLVFTRLNLKTFVFRTLSQFHGTEIYLSSILRWIGMFILSLSVSLALGVAFGLAMSLILKHSSLSGYPSIESCLVLLSAYTCYFFSTGLSMSGIVSLLFCGVTLKHYAYHTMSRRTQRASKYIFSTLAQLSENFIFIYLGIALFTSPPTSEKVTSYVKPIFIAITTVAVIFTRYVAVFPLSEAINFFYKHARGQRTEELPHSYQMMLFWAGLRGAVGVALAAGFQGDNAETLRTTVLVVVVLTVVVFGGTSARMLEILGIRTGVEDDGGMSSDEEDGPLGSVWYRRGSSRVNGRRWGQFLDDESSCLSPGQSHPRGDPTRIGTHYSTYNHQAQLPTVQNNAIFSAASSDSYDSDAEVLPMATTHSTGQPQTNGPVSGEESRGAQESVVNEDGKWFQELDERYLLPIFSNATASRTFHARKARRTAAAAGQGGSSHGTPMESDDDEGAEVELGAAEEGSRPRPTLDMGALENRFELGLPSPRARGSPDVRDRSP
jgi:solute carrier family 9 (sodium/hydrogen exchanger), member 6/7